ncbi:hypothetical protein [Candidatus Mycoplasma haematominutum]|uniref:hypothetical protein n=1 Tax=Candidatus Mycoplasma haematominutum TaxID=209446 RepID=UPI0002F309A2|nr:hypothetical protein [Candidatus Mycoplasma haematominutum]
MILLKALFFLPKWVRRCVYLGVLISGGVVAKKYLAEVKSLVGLTSKGEETQKK